MDVQAFVPTFREVLSSFPASSSDDAKLCGPVIIWLVRGQTYHPLNHHVGSGTYVGGTGGGSWTGFPPKNEFDCGSKTEEEDGTKSGYFLITRSFENQSFEQQAQRAFSSPFAGITGQLTPLTRIVTAGSPPTEEYKYILNESALRPIDVNVARDILSATFTSEGKPFNLPFPLVFFVQDDGRGELKYLGMEPRAVADRACGMLRSEDKENNDSSRLPISSTISLREPILKDQTPPELDALVKPRSSFTSLDSSKTIVTMRYDMHPQPGDIPLRLMQERVFSLVLQWEMSGKVTSLLPNPTDECDATVFAKGGAGDNGDLRESYRHLMLLSMIVDVASTGQGSTPNKEDATDEHTFLFQPSNSEAINEVAERTKAFLEEERRLSTACDRRSEGKSALTQDEPLGDRGDRDFVDRLWSVLQHCHTVSTMVAVMTRVLDHLGGADGLMPSVRKSQKSHFAETVRLAVKMSQLQRFGSALDMGAQFAEMSAKWRHEAQYCRRNDVVPGIVAEIGMAALRQDYLALLTRGGWCDREAFRWYEEVDELSLPIQLVRLRSLHNVAELLIMAERYQLPWDSVRRLLFLALEFYENEDGMDQKFPMFAVNMSRVSGGKMLSSCLLGFQPSHCTLQSGNVTVRLSHISEESASSKQNVVYIPEKESGGRPFILNVFTRRNY